MASSKEYLEFVLDQLADLDGISSKKMMGEYILYYQGKIIGGIYDDRFLVKKTAKAIILLPNAPSVSPYKGAKEMLLIEDVDSRELLDVLINAIFDDLPS